MAQVGLESSPLSLLEALVLPRLCLRIHPNQVPLKLAAKFLAAGCSN